MENKTIMYLLISLFISFYLFTKGGLYIDSSSILLTIIFAIWLTVPAFFNDENEVNLLIGYILWVSVQCAFLYYGVGVSPTVPLFMVG